MGGLIDNEVTISVIDYDVGIFCGDGTGDISDGSHDVTSPIPTDNSHITVNGTNGNSILN